MVRMLASSSAVIFVRYRCLMNECGESLFEHWIGQFSYYLIESNGSLSNVNQNAGPRV